MQLGDLGDSVPWDVSTNNGGHVISAPVYRAPENWLNVPWTTAVDIWSLGATVCPSYELLRCVCSLLSQTFFYLTLRHLFAPNEVEPEDEIFPLAVVALQHHTFGPYPEKFWKMLDEEAAELFKVVIDHFGHVNSSIRKKTTNSTMDRPSRQRLHILSHET